MPPCLLITFSIYKNKEMISIQKLCKYKVSTILCVDYDVETCI